MSCTEELKKSQSCVSCRHVKLLLYQRARTLEVTKATGQVTGPGEGGGDAWLLPGPVLLSLALSPHVSRQAAALHRHPQGHRLPSLFRPHGDCIGSGQSRLPHSLALRKEKKP